MIAESNKNLVRRFLEAVRGMGNLSTVDELVSPGVALHLPLPEEVPGSEGLKDIVLVYRAAFPDLTLTIDDMVAEGDKVAVRFRTKGTNTGPFIEVPPT
jgi:predicted ester cyclase